MNISTFLTGLFVAVFAIVAILWKKRIIFRNSNIRPTVIRHNPLGIGDKYRDKPIETGLTIIVAILLLLGGILMMVISLLS